MGLLEKEIFVCIDCETTGLDPHADRVIEVAAVRFDANQIYERFETLIDPERLISPESMAIHNISDEMVAGKPKIKEILPELLKLIGNHIIVGHGIKFDIDLVANAAEREGIPCSIRKNRYLDTLRLARHYGESPINSLEQLRKHFNIEEEGAHRAMNDVVVNLEVFKYLSHRYKTTKQLFDLLANPILMKIMPLGPHKGRLIKDVPLQYLQWAAYKDFDEDLLFSIRSELKRRKKGNLFSQSGNPFSNL